MTATPLKLNAEDRLVERSNASSSQSSVPGSSQSKNKNKADRSSKKGGGGRPPRPIHTMLFRLFLTLMAWGGVFGIIFVFWFSYDLPDIERLQTSVRKPGVIIQASDGTTIGTYGDLHENMVSVTDLPPHVAQAFLAVEDRRFYSHIGIDFIGFFRALYVNYQANRVKQGGSTLTQQLAKTFLMSQGMYGLHDRSVRRKIQEALMAFWLEWHFTKDQILTIYLNRVYFGAKTWGIEAAARHYYNKSATQLTVFESATFAGLLKAPTRYSPAYHPERSRQRARLVLSLMKEQGYIQSTEEHVNDLPSVAVALTAVKRDSNAKFFSDWVYETLPNLLSINDKDLVVITTFDTDIQKKAEEGVFKVFNEMSKEYRVGEIAMVAMSPNGAVKALIGGTSYIKSQFNRVTQALRQAGSSFKPFVYLAALEQGWAPSSTISAAPITIGNWTPHNFRNMKVGDYITLEEALYKSVNTVTARLAHDVGTQNIANVARRLGITTDLVTDLSMCLGSGEVTLLELTSAYATFANKGMAVEPYGIAEIRDKEGNVLYRRPVDDAKQVIATHHVAQMKKMLTSVVQRGTGTRAKMPFPVAGKTGSNRDQDAWFIGFTEDLVAGVWIGNDDNKPMIKNSVGGRMPAMAWASFMKLVYADHAPKKDETVLDTQEEGVAEEEGDAHTGPQGPYRGPYQDTFSSPHSRADQSDLEAFDPADAEIDEFPGPPPSRPQNHREAHRAHDLDDEDGLSED